MSRTEGFYSFDADNKRVQTGFCAHDANQQLVEIDATAANALII